MTTASITFVGVMYRARTKSELYRLCSMLDALGHRYRILNDRRVIVERGP